MFSVSLSEQQQKDLAKRLVSFLSIYKHISDSYIIEFFTENLWETLPKGWQKALEDLSAPQVAELLLDKQIKHRVYPSVWPLSLLALRTTAHALPFPRTSPGHQMRDKAKQCDFHSSSSQSSLLNHIFRKHVKPKKQHEIHRLGTLVKQLCDQTQCSSVVDVGSGQGHLTRFLSFGLGLHVAAIEADPHLVSTASRFDEQLMTTLSKESHKSGISHTALDTAPRHIVGWVNPRDTWEIFLQHLGKVEKCNESYPGMARPCKKRQWISLSSDKEGELETELVNESQRLCPEESSFVADGDESPATFLLQQHQMETSDCSTQSNTSEHILQTGFGSSLLCKKPNGSFVKKSHVGAVPATKSGQTSSVQPTVHSSISSNFVLTGLHACGDLSATLLRHFANCPNIQGITSVACCYMKITTMENLTPPGVVLPPLSENMKEVSQSDYGYPMSEWVRGLSGHQLSYKAREGACHAIEDYICRLREESSLLKTHCYRAALETIIRAEKPELCRAGIQTIKKAHMLQFSEYARLGLSRVGLPSDLDFDFVNVEGLLKQQGRVVVYFSLALLLAPVVETLVLLDRMLFLQERGLQSQLIPLFDPVFSPRNFVLVAVKPKADGEEACSWNNYKAVKHS